MEVKPKISVVTVVYNGEKYIEKTIQSVTEQTYQNLEYIIIDGKSKDKSVSIANKYKTKIDLIISEPDKGIYDAMNKGIRYSKGDFVVFMNAGDLFYSPNTLQQIVSTCNKIPDIYYGETMIMSENGENIGIRSIFTPHRLPQKLTTNSMKLGMVVCHQSILIKKNILEQFDLSHPYCADIDSIIKALKVSNQTHHTHLIIAKYLKGGISDRHKWESLKDRFWVFVKHFGLLQTIFLHAIIVVRATARICFKAFVVLLPQKKALNCTVKSFLCRLRIIV